MITTITFNPAIDKRYYVNKISLGEVQRVVEVENTAGGKGLNVSRVASLLGEKVTATGLLGGANGDFIAKELIKMDIENKFQSIIGETRTCLAIIDDNKNQTELLESGPEITNEEFAGWMTIYRELLNTTDIIVASGSLPKGLTDDTYSIIIKEAKAKGVKFFLDTSGQALIKSLDSAPYFIKPNTDEIKLITNKESNSREDIIEAIKYLLSKGIEIVTVSLGKGGSITGHGKKLYEAVIPKVQAVNSVGSGDSFTAGMAVAIKRGMSMEDAIKFASACGTANAMEKQTGFISQENVDSLFQRIQVIISDI